MSEVDVAIAVLANDREFQTKVANQIALGAGAQVLGRVISVDIAAVRSDTSRS